MKLLHALALCPLLFALPGAADDTSNLDAWWSQLQSLCGQAYSGKVTSTDAADAEWAKEELTMHVRRCAAERIEIPFHVGDNRSRTWVLTRVDEGVQLQHDHRHEDGSEDTVTLYGGLSTAAPEGPALQFPVDEYSKKLFADEGLEASVTNVWTMEVVPGERFSYILRRAGRHFQADFDLTRPVAAPPVPWGHE